MTTLSWRMTQMATARISIGKVGLAAGIILGGTHLCWSALVALGWAQRVADFIFWMHFIKPIYVIEPFEITRAFILILVTAAIGFVLGSAGAWALGTPCTKPDTRLCRDLRRRHSLGRPIFLNLARWRLPKPPAAPDWSRSSFLHGGVAEVCRGGLRSCAHRSGLIDSRPRALWATRL